MNIDQERGGKWDNLKHFDFCFRVVCRTDETRTGVITDNITITFTYGLTVNSSNPFQFLVSNNNIIVSTNDCSLNY